MSKELQTRNNNTSVILHSKKSFVENFEPKKCLWKFRDVPNIWSMLENFEQTSLEEFSLNSIMKVHSEKWTINYVELWIIDLLDFLNLKKSMTKPQIQETAFHITSTYSRFNLVDMTLIFRRLKQGFYGEFYGSIDGSKILVAFKKYSEERLTTQNEMKRKKLEE